jgi:hypothetical protein
MGEHPSAQNGGYVPIRDWANRYEVCASNIISSCHPVQGNISLQYVGIQNDESLWILPLQSHVGEGSKGFIVLLYQICERDRVPPYEIHIAIPPEISWRATANDLYDSKIVKKKLPEGDITNSFIKTVLGCPHIWCITKCRMVLPNMKTVPISIPQFPPDSLHNTPYALNNTETGALLLMFYHHVKTAT